jgi:hypothetical protein
MIDICPEPDNMEVSSAQIHSKILSLEGRALELIKNTEESTQIQMMME